MLEKLNTVDWTQYNHPIDIPAALRKLTSDDHATVNNAALDIEKGIFEPLVLYITGPERIAAFSDDIIPTICNVLIDLILNETLLHKNRVIGIVHTALTMANETLEDAPDNPHAQATKTLILTHLDDYIERTIHPAYQNGIMLYVLFALIENCAFEVSDKKADDILVILSDYLKTAKTRHLKNNLFDAITDIATDRGYSIQQINQLLHRN